MIARVPYLTFAIASLSSLALGLLGTGCGSLPDINLTTDEPIKVDINVRLDVYQHLGGSSAEGGGNGDDAAVLDRSSLEAVANRKRGRMNEIQELKNNRVIGENHRGLLTILKLPLESYGDYVKKTVDDENKDRTYLMRTEAEERGILFHEVQEQTWKANVERSYPGESVEIQGEKEGSFTWKQKQ